MEKLRRKILKFLVWNKDIRQEIKFKYINMREIQFGNNNMLYCLKKF